MENLPTLTTLETQRLRADYPSIEHLEAGNVAAWLVERQEQLLVRARDERTGMNLAKLITLTGGAVGAVCYATSPLALIGAALAGVGYVWAVATDLNDSHQFAPLPFVRGNIVEFLSAMGDRDAREEWFANQNELVDLMFHLDPFERYEFAMLKENVHKLSDFLVGVEPGKRFYAYRWLLDWYINLKGNLPSKDSLTNHLIAVTPDPRVNYQQVGAIQQHQAQALIDVPNTSTVDLPDTPTVSLPEAQSVDLPGTVGASTKLGAIDVEAKSIETEQLTPPVGDAPKANTQSPVDTPQSVSMIQPTEAIPSPAGNAIVQQPAPSSTKWINNFISQTGLIWGNQGSGKSWMARYVAKLKKDKGYRVVVLDPDSNRAEWQGVESYHDFEEIAEFLSWYVEELKGRYKAFNASNMTEDAWRAKLWAEGKALALICEEVTTYVDLIEDKELLTQFFRLGLTKSRKQEMPLTFVSHNNNQTALGGIKGLANLIDKMLQLELQTDIDAETLQPVASGKGAVKLDGSNQWVPVTLPHLEKKITNFGESQPTVVQQPVTTPSTELKEEAIACPEPTTELKVSDSLAEPLKSIWLFAKKKNDWVTVRNVYDQKMKVLEGKKVEQIHQYLGLLADSGLGEIDEDGKSHSAVGFRAY